VRVDQDHSSPRIRFANTAVLGTHYSLELSPNQKLTTQPHKASFISGGVYSLHDPYRLTMWTRLDVSVGRGSRTEGESRMDTYILAEGPDPPGIHVHCVLIA
jgi:hypothetical protein